MQPKISECRDCDPSVGFFCEDCSRPPEITLTKSSKKVNGGAYWYTKPGSVRFTQMDMVKEIQKGTQIIFNGGQEHEQLFALISLLEKESSGSVRLNFNKQGDTALLNRIIRAGGFCEYIDTLNQTKRYVEAGF